MYIERNISWVDHLHNFEVKFLVVLECFVRYYFSSNALMPFYFRFSYSHLQYAICFRVGAGKTVMKRLNVLLQSNKNNDLQFFSFFFHLFLSYLLWGSGKNYDSDRELPPELYWSSSRLQSITLKCSH